MRLLTLAAVLGATTCLSGCFFVFIPGSLIQKASDGITGAEGEHCVAQATKVGDLIKLADGRVGTVRSLSGTSVRCQDPQWPIRAALEFK